MSDPWYCPRCDGSLHGGPCATPAAPREPLDVTTEAGRNAYRRGEASLSAILAIEAEARADALRDAAEKVEGLDHRMVEWWNPDGKTYSLAQVVMWTRVLTILRGTPE